MECFVSIGDAGLEREDQEEFHLDRSGCFFCINSGAVRLGIEGCALDESQGSELGGSEHLNNLK